MDTPSPSVITNPDKEIKTEVVVIGSGPGGSMTAYELSAAGRDVLLVEEGPYYGLNDFDHFSISEMAHKYRNGGLTVAMGKPKVAYVEGRCVGGGSEVNSGLYHRTPNAILESWKENFRVENLTEKDLLPHFEFSEKEISVSPMPGNIPAASLKLHDGAKKLNWYSLEVPRWMKYEGPKQTRQTMTETFIPKALKNGCKLLPETRADTIKKDGHRWVLKATHKGKRLKITAETVFVTSGSIHTPALLKRSGITKNIGESLRFHPTVKVAARFKETVNALDMGVPVHQVKEFSPRISFGCAISTPPYLSVTMNDHPAYTEEILSHWENTAVYYAAVVGSGTGRVSSVPGHNDPLVKYNLSDEDMKTLSEGLKKLCQLLFEVGAQEIYPSVTKSDRLTSQKDIDTIPASLPRNRTNLMTIHLLSSCPMGEDKNKCATDSFGKVHGFDNLYINDASLLCTPPGVNPQGSILAVARRNAHHFLGKNT